MLSNSGTCLTSIKIVSKCFISILLNALQCMEGALMESEGRIPLQPECSLAAVLAAGADLAREQQAVMDTRLVKEYMKGKLQHIA